MIAVVQTGLLVGRGCRDGQQFRILINSKNREKRNIKKKCKIENCKLQPLCRSTALLLNVTFDRKIVTIIKQECFFCVIEGEE